MPIKVTQNWRSERRSLAWPWEAYLEFVVTGTTSVAEALTAVDPTTGVAVYQRGAGHPENPVRLICGGPQVQEHPGPDYWVIGCPFAASTTGEATPIEDDPLQQPAVIRWEHVEVIEQVDRDMDGRPILNLAGFPFDTPSTRPITYKRFTILKNFPFFDLTLCEAYDNSVNSAPISLGLGLTAATHHLRCASIIPAAEYTATATYVPMAFTFELIAANTLGQYPFQERRMNQGREGWNSDGKTFPFSVLDPVTSQYEPVGNMIRLGTGGTPLSIYSGNIKVGPDGATPSSPPFTTPRTLATEVLSDAVWLYYQKTRIVDMTPLLALL